MYLIAQRPTQGMKILVEEASKVPGKDTGTESRGTLLLAITEQALRSTGRGRLSPPPSRLLALDPSMD